LSQVSTTSEATAASKQGRFVDIPWFALATALTWSMSPILVREGLVGLPSPLIGVAIGMTVNVIPYAVLVLWQRQRWVGSSISRKTMLLQIIAGVFVTIGTWSRWLATDLTSIAAVLALSRLSVPVVFILGIFVLDQTTERITIRVWFGAALIVLGAILLILS